ncbi:MAG TPA: UDP-N-acetylmuramoyl-tripeptide--D-alanyl-D-alanine ligase [Methylomirabilota bacterium]|nr:UDP-N-acetylmuramoyl-tripeptide--D-alanyl-D-alanine ligase [Methylomirabilota bacterium]
MRWTVGEVAGALDVAPPAGLDPVARLAGVSIDSRTVGRGELFVAIQGPRHDGHSFVAAALESGALGAVVARGRMAEFPAQLRGRLIPVDDTLAALQGLARAVRRKWGRKLAGITGSVGKTTTKEILAALLAAQFTVLKSEGNLNNEFGLPLTLLRLEETHEAAAVELGMSHAGELRRLAGIAQPDVGVVTRVAPVHLEFFASVDEIALAKRELIEGLPGSGSVAVLNADDPRVATFARVAPGRVVTFGASPTADFRAAEIEDCGDGGTSFDFIFPGGSARLDLALGGRHNVENALAALAAASVWGVGAAEAADVFPRLRPAGMRGQVVHFAAGFTVINDSYNSNPLALDAMITLLASHTEAHRRILIAGEMLELGSRSAELHHEAGLRAGARGNLDWIIGVQGDAAQLVRGAIEAGQPDARAEFFADSGDAAKAIASLVAPGDVLLVKGSRGVKMERIVEALEARYAVESEPAANSAASPAAGERA